MLLRFLLSNLLLVAVHGIVFGQGTEDFTNLPTASPGTYAARTWIGTDGVTWNATASRTDQVLTGKAICTNSTASITSPLYSGGIGTLTFNYVRGFTGTSARTLQVWVNGTQIGANIFVNATSSTVQNYSAAINISGSVQLEIRASGAQIIVDDINWTAHATSPTIQMAAATSSHNENAGSVSVTLNISPATTSATSVTLSITNGAGVFYGAPPNDYTTTPAAVGGTFTVSIPTASSTATFNVNIFDDLMTEANETITFTVTSVGAGLSLGAALTHTLTIVNNDNTPTANFGLASATVLEGNSVVVPVTIIPTPLVTTTVVLQAIPGAGVTYELPAPPYDGNDYTSAPPEASGLVTLTFLAGVGTQNITITAYNDGAPEPTEFLQYVIQSVSGGVVGSFANTTITIGDVNSPPTVLGVGDLVVVGYNANDVGCGTTGDDFVSFFCFKPIVPGTEILITDNGYERAIPGLWGDGEGTVRMKRDGIAIPAGQVITFRFSMTGVNVVSVAPDAAWTCTTLGANPVNLNNNGDQIFFMQGGAWSNGSAAANDGTYTGSVLYGFSTNGVWQSFMNSSQHSGLPLSLECFSMSPTIATDYCKYTGPITPTSQRGWVINVDNSGNWSNYGDCTAYNTATPNWMAAPILPITIAPFVPGRWLGSTNTNWFDCKNWDDARVPDLTTAVVIDPLWSAGNCVVGFGAHAGSTAQCASLVQSSGGAIRQLTVQSGSTLTVNGPLTISRAAAGGNLTTTVLDNSTLNCSTLTIEGVTPGAVNEGILRCDAGGTVRVEDDLLIGVGGLLDLQGTASASGTLYLGGDWTNQGSESSFQDQFSTVIMNGNNDQGLSIASGAEVFNNLTLGKSGGELVLNSGMTIRSTLSLTTGRIRTGPAMLTMLAGTSVVGGSNGSHVNGPMEKIGNTNFTFPVGKGGQYRPCGISSISGSVTDAFRAEYFPLTAATWGTTGDPSLHHISTCEYWTIDRSVGTPSAVISLTWNTPASCGVTSMPDLRVAQWDDTALPAPGTWRDRGNGGATGTMITGTIPTAAVQSAFNATTTAWTLGSISVANPLPIRLLRFTAQPVGTVVQLDWATASETNNAYFKVERSKDGITFVEVVEVPGANNSNTLNEYQSWDDQPLSGLSYYRLRQTDLDGTSTYSDLVAVLFGPVNERPLVIFGDGANWTALHSFPAGSRYELVDMTGRRILSGNTFMDGRTDFYGLSLSRGAYLLRISDGERMESQRFVF